MLFQVLSDLHLEVGHQYGTFDVDARAPYLILSGDIGRLTDYDELLGFLERQCAKFTKVLMVLGNHEMYGSSRMTGLEAAERLQSEMGLQERFVLLNQTRVDLSPDVTVLGCTLHSHISDASRDTVQTKLKDFTRIQGWTVANHNATHADDVAWLQSQIRTIRNVEDSFATPRQQRRKIVVVTHHAPSRLQTSQVQYENNLWSDGFATDLLTGCAETNPLLRCNWWVFGHTHYTTYFEIDGVKVFSNQRGYVFPWQSKEENNTRDRSRLRALTLRNKVKMRIPVGRFRSQLHYEKQMRHEFDIGATIDV